MRFVAISWPLCSPDSTVLNISFLWEYMKCYVVRTFVDDNEKFRARIIETIQSVVKTVLIRTWS